MSQLQEIIAIAVIVAITGVGLVVGLLRPGGRSTKELPPKAPQPGRDYAPGVGDDAAEPRDTPTRRIEDIAGLDTLQPPEVEEEPEMPLAPSLERPAPAGGRLQRLRSRLARSNSAFGQSLLGLLSRGGPGRAGVGGRRGHAAGLRPRRRGVDGARRLAAHPGQGRGRPRRGDRARVAARRPARARRPRHGPLDRLVPRRGAPGRHPRGRRQRHRQDHHGRQARPRPGRRGQGRRARRGRHLPCRRRRPAADLGRAGRRRHRPLRP